MREVMSTFIVTLAGLVIVSTAVLAFVVAPGLRAQPETSDLPQATMVREGHFTQPTVVRDMPDEWSEPVLTDEQKERAVAIASNDQRVRSMLAAHQYGVTDSVVWTGDAGHIMGAVVTMSFGTPTTVTGEWLSFSWSCEQQPLPLPESVPYSATFAGVTSIQVFSNLVTAEVDQIIPFSDAGVTLVGPPVFTGETTSITSCYED